MSTILKFRLEPALKEEVVHTPPTKKATTTIRYRVKQKSLLYIALAGLAGVVVAVGPLAWRAGSVAFAAEPTPAPSAKVTPLFSKDLAEFPGKEGIMITVVYPPGSVDVVHRHNAHAFLYVLEGSIVMQLKGEKEVTLKSGDTFYEGPNDIHTVGRNASKTEPAKFVVFLVKDKGAPVLIPEK
jgi:quercetin dioxygenase-like cupin family protein